MKSGENKFVLGMILTVAVMLISFSFISATSTGRGLVSETVINGVVTYAENGQPVGGADVRIKCGLVSNTGTTTNPDGSYSFDLLKKKCGKNSKATIIVTKDGEYGFKTKTVNSGGVTINVMLGEPFSGTMVTGIIYGSDMKTPVGGAKVTVTCNDNVKTNTSKSDGTYFVIYDEDECNEGDTAMVVAEKNDVTGSNTGIVHDGILGFLDVAVVNVPLVPEFGVVAGMITVLGAVGTFFFIRKKEHVRVKKRL